MNSIFRIGGRLLVRNTVLNFVGQVIPLVIGIATIPFIIRELGADGFGILSLAWMMLGYFSLFDLGLGRATTKFVAEAMGKGEIEKLPHLVWVSLAIHLVLGIITGLLITTLTPFLVERVFSIPTALKGEAEVTFFILGISVPIILAAIMLRGVLEASQRFDLVNIVKIPTSSLTFLLPAIGLLFGFGLVGITALLMLAKVGSALAYLTLCLRVFPVLKKGFSFDPKIIRPMVFYGGWITISNVVGPVLTYLDRFVIGVLLSMSAVAYYTAPYEVVTRLWIFSSSLVVVLFPAFSAIGAASKKTLVDIYSRSIKYLLLIMGPLVMILILFAEEILRLWLGGEFAEKSTLVFQILAVGVLSSALAQVPFGLIQGLGRPDVTAKFHLLQLLLYVPLVWFLVGAFGIAGGALAWTLRVELDTIMLLGASWKFYQMSPQVLAKNGLLRCGVLFTVLAGGLLITLLLITAILTKAIITILLVAFFALSVWRYVLDVKDKSFINSVVHQIGNAGKNVA